MKRRISLLFIASCCSVLVKAQAVSSATQSTALSLSNAISLTFVSSGSGSGSSVNMPFTTIGDLINGVSSGAQSLKVQSNKAFNVSVNSTSLFFTFAGIGSLINMPILSTLGLEVSTNNTGGTIASSFNNSYGTLSFFSQTLLSGCSSGSNQTFDVKYKTTPGLSFPAGTYTASIVYTATQP